MGFGHQANLARRWPAGRLSAPARATEGNAYRKGGAKAHKTVDTEIRNALEAAAGEGGQTALRSMTIGDQSARTCQRTRAGLLAGIRERPGGGRHVPLHPLIHQVQFS